MFTEMNTPRHVAGWFNRHSNMLINFGAAPYRITCITGHFWTSRREGARNGVREKGCERVRVNCRARSTCCMRWSHFQEAGGWRIGQAPLRPSEEWRRYGASGPGQKWSSSSDTVVCWTRMSIPPASVSEPSRIPPTSWRRKTDISVIRCKNAGSINPFNSLHFS